MSIYEKNTDLELNNIFSESLKLKLFRNNKNINNIKDFDKVIKNNTVKLTELRNMLGNKLAALDDYISLTSNTSKLFEIYKKQFANIKDFDESDQNDNNITCPYCEHSMDPSDCPDLFYNDIDANDVEKYQYTILLDLQSIGYNVVDCAHCGHTFLHKH